MAKLHGFGRPMMEPITEFDAGDGDVIPWQKPKYARQLAMVDEEKAGSLQKRKPRKNGWIPTT